MNDLVIGMLLGAIGLGVVAGLSRSKERKGNVAKFTEVARHTNSDTAELMALVQQGKKIEAIKLVREHSGLDLKAAKEIVDKMAKGEAVELPPMNFQQNAMLMPPGYTGDLDQAQLRNLRRLAFEQNQKIEALKYLREQTGLGLKEAKDLLDGLLAKWERGG